MSIYTEEAERRSKERRGKCPICGLRGTAEDIRQHLNYHAERESSPRVVAECWTCAASQPSYIYDPEIGRSTKTSVPLASQECLAAGHDVRERRSR
jgi:hypothetical protein